MVNFYKEMYPHRAHITKLLTKRTGKGRKFEWTSKMERAFQKLKASSPKIPSLFICGTEGSLFSIQIPLTTS